MCMCIITWPGAYRIPFRFGCAPLKNPSHQACHLDGEESWLKQLMKIGMDERSNVDPCGLLTWPSVPFCSRRINRCIICMYVTIKAKRFSSRLLTTSEGGALFEWSLRCDETCSFLIDWYLYVCASTEYDTGMIVILASQLSYPLWWARG